MEALASLMGHTENILRGQQTCWLHPNVKSMAVEGEVAATCYQELILLLH